MFSEALLTMDKNTVNYMIEKQKNVLEEITKENQQHKAALEEAPKELAQLRTEMERLHKPF